MLKCSHTTLIILSGLTWLMVGGILLPVGLNLMVATLLRENSQNYYPLLDLLAPYFGGRESAALCLIALTLLIGFLKGRHVFARSVDKSVRRIAQLPSPCPLSKLYEKNYYFLIALMMGIGFLVRLFPSDVRGGIDIAVGSALINGSVLYFRSAWQMRKPA